MVYGELGRYPLLIAAKMRILSFWARLITSQETNISCMLYKLLYKIHVSNFYHNEWLMYIKKTLCECGFPVFWDQQNIPGNLNYFKFLLNLRLKDQVFQSWSADMHNNSKCVVYRMYKVNLTFENYLTEFSDYLRFSYLRFRCRNNNFPVERGARENIPRILRICTFCNDGSIGDEFHYLLQCKHFLKDRLLYLKCRSFINPSTLTFKQIMNPTSSLLPLCKFINVIIKKCFINICMIS